MLTCNFYNHKPEHAGVVQHQPVRYKVQDRVPGRHGRGEDIHNLAIREGRVRASQQCTAAATQPTIGIDFLCRNLTFEKSTYRLQLWDTAGQ